MVTTKTKAPTKQPVAAKPAKGTKTAKAKAKAASTSHADDKSTREMILIKSLELINTKGMVDFRIDTLATSLGLSPGNITYHFSRKEDICVALWEQYLEEYGKVVRSLTTLLDLRQLYLINRINIKLNYKYRGVVIFRSADLGAMSRDIESGRTNDRQHYEISKQVMELLAMNDYLDKKAPDFLVEVIHTYHYIIMRWCLNLAYQIYRPDEVESKLDYLALLSLHALYPSFSKKGQDEFAEIMKTVIGEKLVPEGMK